MQFLATEQQRSQNTNNLTTVAATAIVNLTIEQLRQLTAADKRVKQPSLPLSPDQNLSWDLSANKLLYGQKDFTK